MSIFSILKDVALFLSAIFVMGFLILFVKSLSFRPKIKVLDALNYAKSPQADLETQYKELIQKRWRRISDVLKAGDERDFRLAIIEADSLIDEILIRHGHIGKDMGERLKSILPHELKNLDNLWEAHKIRNQIAHDANFRISKNQAEKAINVYHKVLREWGVL
jgi:hypothetical protein